MKEEKKKKLHVRSVGGLSQSHRKVTKINPDDLLHLLYADRASISKLSKTHRIARNVLPSEKTAEGHPLKNGNIEETTNTNATENKEALSGNQKFSSPRASVSAKTSSEPSSFMGGLRKTLQNAVAIVMNPQVAQEVYNSFIATRSPQKAKTYKAYVCGKFYRIVGQDVPYWMENAHAPHAKYGLIVKAEGYPTPFHIAVPRSQYESEELCADLSLHEKLIREASSQRSSNENVREIFSHLPSSTLAKNSFDLRLMRVNGQIVMTHFNNDASWFSLVNPSLALQRLIDFRTQMAENEKEFKRRRHH